MAEDASAGRAASPGVRFAAAKFRPTTLPATLVTRPELHDRLTAGGGQRLTVVVGSAGAGKSVLLSSWAAARPPGLTSWLSCDAADATPVRFWAGFIQAPRASAPWFGGDAADLLAMDGGMSADVSAAIADDAARLPAGSAIVVDDFHYAAGAVAGDMSDLVGHWPAQAAQLVLASRVDPPLRLHRLRMASQLCELRDRDLYFSLAESHDLLAGFGVRVTADEVALLHQRTEGWAAALQMAALSLHGATDPARAARALDIRATTIAQYFVSEVLDQQPPDIAWFMLDTSVLGELTADACAAVTARPDAAALLRHIAAASLFLVPQDDEGTSFRYHHLVHQLLRAELLVRDRDREQELQLRAARWFEAAGDARRAARHFLAARQADRALALLQDRVLPDFLNDPVLPQALDLSTTIAPSLLAQAPYGLLGVATDLLLMGDAARGGQYLDLLERAQPPITPESRMGARLAAVQSFRYAMAGQAEQAAEQALAARAIQRRTQLADEWDAAVPLILLSVYMWLEDYAAVDREAAVVLAIPELSEPARLVNTVGAQALAWFEAGRLAEAADAAQAARKEALRLGFDRHFFAQDYLRALAGLALERRELDTAEQLTEQALSITERRRPPYEFLALLDRAAIWAARGQVREALASLEETRQVLAGTGSPLLARADELEALLRLSLGDLRSSAELASRLPAARRPLVLAKIALGAGDHQAAREHLRTLPPGGLTPRRALVCQLLLAAAAISRGAPEADSLVRGSLSAARGGGFLNTVVTTAPQLASYLVGHPFQARADPFAEQLVAAALGVRAAQLGPASSRRALAEPLTPAETRVLQLLPTSTYVQMAATLTVSHNTVKTHLRAVYQKLGVTSRAEAIERAVDLRLL